MVYAHARFLKNARPLSVLLVMSALAPVGMTVLGTTTACRAEAAKPAAITSAQRTNALAGAQRAIKRSAQAKSPTGFADILTRKSAASVGAFLLALAGMSAGNNQQTGTTPPGHVSAVKLKKDYAALLARWGSRENDQGSVVPLSGVPVGSNGLPLLIAKNGRRFLVDVFAFMNEIDPNNAASFSSAGASSVSDFTYTVLSPTRVGLTPKSKSVAKSQPPVAAVFEDGKWRLDLGDIMKNSSPKSDPAAKQPTN